MQENFVRFAKRLGEFDVVVNKFEPVVWNRDNRIKAAAQIGNSFLGLSQAALAFNGIAQAAGKQTGGKRIVPVSGNTLVSTPPKPGPAPADKQASVMLGLLLGSPEFQRR